MTRISKLNIVSAVYHEKSDCAVKATAIVCNVEYKEAWDMLSRQGRKPRKGTNFEDVTKPAIEKAGYTVTLLENHIMNRAKTIRTLKYKIPSRGVFLVRVRAHILAVRGGEIHDWSENTCKRIKSIWRVSMGS